MSIEEVIKEAMLGGFDVRSLNGFDEEVVYLRSKPKNINADLFTFQNIEYQYQQILLDPIFWEALGRVRRWRPVEWEVMPKVGVMALEPSNIPVHAVSFPKRTEGYRYHWHRFIDHLAEGKDAESFFAELK